MITFSGFLVNSRSDGLYCQFTFLVDEIQNISNIAVEFS